MRNFLMITAACVLLAGFTAADVSAVETDHNYSSCIDGVCTTIPIVQSVPQTAAFIGEFYRPHVTYDANGNVTTKMVLVRRYALHGHQYRPCSK